MLDGREKYSKLAELSAENLNKSGKTRFMWIFNIWIEQGTECRSFLRASNPQQTRFTEFLLTYALEKK